jgi:hypothetical protein
MIWIRRRGFGFGLTRCIVISGGGFIGFFVCFVRRGSVVIGVWFGRRFVRSVWRIIRL